MPNNSLEEQLVKYLTDVHSIEQQALAQLRTAPDIAGDPELADMFRAHEKETEEQKRLIEARLGSHGGRREEGADVAAAAAVGRYVVAADARGGSGTPPRVLDGHVSPRSR